MLLPRKRIFIIEDNQQNRVIFQVILGLQGASVDFERSGKDTLSRLLLRPLNDIIILDLMLAQGISGWDIFDDIRRETRYDSIPIVAVSAMDPAIAIPKCREKGFQGFIAKPIDDALFPKQIAQILSGEPLWYVGGLQTPQRE